MLSTPAASRPSQTWRARGVGRIDLDADQQALAAHFGDRRVVDRAQLGEQLVAAHARLLAQALAQQQVERGDADRRGERVAAEGAAVVAGMEDRHDLLAGEEGADRQQAAAERLAEHQAVGADAFVVAGEQRAGAAEAGLHLVADQQDAAPGADLARLAPGSRPAAR